MYGASRSNRLAAMNGEATILLSFIFLSAFLKVLTALNILRYGLGLKDFAFGIVTLALAIVISLPSAPSALTANAPQKLPNSLSEEQQSLLKSKTKVEILARVTKVLDSIPQSATPTSERMFGKEQPLVIAYCVSELSEAFRIGLLFLIPFILIDLLIANCLAALGVTQIGASVVALPCKLLLFVAVDGWSLVVEKLLYGGVGG